MSVGPISGELAIESNFPFYYVKGYTEKWSQPLAAFCVRVGLC